LSFLFITCKKKIKKTFLKDGHSTQKKTNNNEKQQKQRKLKQKQKLKENLRPKRNWGPPL